MRFNPLPLILGHWRGLSIVDSHGDFNGGDYVTRALLLLGSALAGFAVGWYEVRLAAPAAILSGFALLSGVLLSVFAQLASMRTRLTEKEVESKRDRVLKDSLDESVSHVLLAALIGIVASAIIIVAMTAGTTAPGEQQEIQTGWAVPVTMLGVYEFLLLVMLIPRLYSAYARANDVAPEINGYGPGDPKGNHIRVIPGQD